MAPIKAACNECGEVWVAGESTPETSLSEALALVGGQCPACGGCWVGLHFGRST